MTQASEARSRPPAEPWTCSARRGERVLASALVLFGGFFAWQAFLLPLGTVAMPGAGFFPLMLAVLLAALAAVTIAGTLRPDETEERVGLARRDVLGTIVMMFSIPLLFETLGAYATLGLFSTALLVFLARLSPARAVAASAVGMAAAWLFFNLLLGLQLPAGVLI
jgi:hypothetical protein